MDSESPSTAAEIPLKVSNKLKMKCALSLSEFTSAALC